VNKAKLDDPVLPLPWKGASIPHLRRHSKIYRKGEDAVGNLRDESSLEFKVFSWGFYVNSTIHRIVWACERLLGGISANEHDGFATILKECRKKSCKSDTPMLTKVLEQFLGDSCYQCSVVKSRNVLSILRQRVNRQKHWYLKADEQQTSGEKDKVAKWDDLTSQVQYRFVVSALELILDLYVEARQTTIPVSATGG
jgi:hypothetical protein